MNTTNTTDYRIKTVKVELEFSLETIKELISSQYPKALSVMNDHTIAEAIQAGFAHRYWESDLDEWILNYDPAFKKLMDAIWDCQYYIECQQ
jgi:hypothetical protein